MPYLVPDRNPHCLNKSRAGATSINADGLLPDTISPFILSKMMILSIFGVRRAHLSRVAFAAESANSSQAAFL